MDPSYLKWSGKFRQGAEKYPTRPDGCVNEETTAVCQGHALHDTEKANFSNKFKAAVTLEASRNDKTGQKFAVKRQLHPTQVST